MNQYSWCCSFCGFEAQIEMNRPKISRIRIGLSVPCIHECIHLWQPKKCIYFCFCWCIVLRAPRTNTQHFHNMENSKNSSTLAVLLECFSLISFSFCRSLLFATKNYAPTTILRMDTIARALPIGVTWTSVLIWFRVCAIFKSKSKKMKML